MADIGGIQGTGNGNSTSSTGPVSAAAALSALRKHSVSTIEISDSVQNILKNIDALQAYAAKITTLSTTDASKNMVVTGAQYQKDRAVLAVWGAGSGQTVGITGALASTTASLPSYVTSLSIADTTANIQRNLDNLQTLAAAGTLSEIVQTGNPGNITITSTQLANDQDALDKIKNHAYTLAIAGANVSDVLGLDAQTPLSSNAKIKSISIIDSTDAIASNLDALQRVGLRIKSISQTDAATHLTVTGDQYKKDKTILGKIVTSDMLAVIDASASQVKALAADHKVVTVDIQDTASNLARNWSLLDDLGNSLTSIVVSDQANAIRLTADQFASSTTVLSKFTDTVDHSYKLRVASVASGNALDVATAHNVDSVEITDSVANLMTNMGDLRTIDGLGKLSSITVSGPPLISTDVAFLQGADHVANQSVLDKIKGHNYTLAVTGAAASDLAGLAGNNRVVSVAVGDSSANIKSALSTLHQLGSRLKTIAQSDAGSAFDLTQAEMDANATVLSKIAGGYTANLTAVTAGKAASDALNMHVAHMEVSDTGRNILAHWNELRAIGSNLTSVSQSDSSALTISADSYQLGVHDNLVAKLGLTPTFTVTGASLAQAQAISGDQVVTEIDVAEDGSVIAENLTDLSTLVTGGKLKSIINQTPTASLAMDASQLAGAQPVLDLIKNGNYTLALSGVDVGDAKDLLTANHKISAMTVTGSAADIVTNLSDLNGLGRKLTTITQTDAPAQMLEMTGQAFSRNSAALAKIEGGYLAVLTDVTAAQAASFAAKSTVSSLSVSDTGAHLASAWTSLGEVGNKLTEVAQSDSSTLQLNANDWLNGQTLRGKFTSDPVVSLSGATVDQVTDLASDDAVTAVQVQDSASALSASLSDLAAEAKVTQLVVQDPNVALTMSGQTFSDSTAILAMVKNGQYKVALSDVTAQDGAAWAGNTHVASMEVSDTSTEISANFTALADATNVDSINVSDEDGTVTLTSDQILSNAATLDKLSGSYQLAATGVAMIDLSAIQDVPQVSSISISDTSDNVSANFSDVLALGDNLTAIHLTDGSPVLSMSQEDWTAGTTALATIDGSYQVDVTDTVAGDAQTVASDGHVRQVAVADTASNVVNQWDTLVGLYDGGAGKLTGISLSDANPLVLTADQQTAGADMITALLPDETIITA